MSFDIASLSVIESTVLHLTHPVDGSKLFADADKKEPITVTLASQSSREYREVVNTISNRRLKRERDAKGRAPATTLEQAQDESLEMLSALCLDSTIPYLGKVVKTNADFRALLGDSKMLWVRSQIDVAVGDLELFIKGSSTN